MNSQREAFEKEFPLSEDTRWSDERGIYVVKDYDGKYPDLGQNMLYIAWQKGSEWQAATEQGVGEAVGWLVGDEFFRRRSDAIEASIYHSDHKDVQPVYTHPPKPTGGGVPDGWSFRKQGDSILVQYHENGGFVKGRWIDKQSERFSFEFFDALLATQQPPEQQASFQYRVDPWLIECFGEQIARDQVERNHRFLEEALELVQSTGCAEAEANELVSYVYGREIGDPPQEVGGVMVTLAALCLAQDMDMHDAGEVELARIWTKVPQIREKQKAKPAMSPLPGVYPDRQPPEQE